MRGGGMDWIYLAKYMSRDNLPAVFLHGNEFSFP